MTFAWTASREELVALLEKESPDLAGLYRHAIDTLVAYPLSFTTVLVVGQCIRELFNGLPRVLGDPVSDRSGVDRPAKELFDAWSAADMSFTPVSDTDDSPQSIPAVVHRAALAVASSAAAGHQNARELTALLATGRVANLEDASMRRLHAAIEFFRKWAHRRDYSQPDRTLPSIDALETELRIVEEAMLIRLGNLADRARAIRASLKAANRRLDDST